MIRYPLLEFEHTYQREKSIETALHSLVTKIGCSMLVKQHAFANIVDIQGALDSITFAEIQEALNSRNVGGALI